MTGEPEPITLGLRRPKAAAIRLLWLPVLVAGAVWAILGVAGWQAPLWQLWLLALVFTAATTVTVPLSSPYPEPDDLLPVHGRSFDERSFWTVLRWESRLSGQHDQEDFRRLVQQRIVPLAVERLRLRHGVDLATDAKRAHAILGDELYRFCTRPVTGVPHRTDLERLVTRIEGI